MVVKIPEEVLKVAVKCPHSFSCLESKKCGEKEMCEIDTTDGNNVLYLKDAEQKTCPYRLKCGFQVCTCPVHYAMAKMSQKQD